MRQLLFLLLALSLTSVSSCKKDKNKGKKAELSIVFKATYGNDPLVVYTDYTTPNGQLIQFHVLDFMLSDLQLVKDNGELLPLKDIDFINFGTNVNLDKANAGIKVDFKDLDPADFKEIRFGVGVSPQMNAKSPGDYLSSSPLGDAGNYWTAWNSYIFSRVEGRIDTTPSAAGGTLGYLYHSGVDGMYQSKVFNKNFKLEAGKNTQLLIRLDAKNIFHKAGAEINIAAANVSHSGAVGTPDYDLVKTVITRLADALVLD